VGHLLAGGPPAGFKARARGEARLQGNLTDVAKARAEITLVELQGGVADFKVQNRDPVRLALGDGRVELRTVTLVGANTELSLSGSREADGKLSVVAEGAADLRLLGGVVPGVTRPQGRLQIEAHLTGTATEPLLVGSGRVRDAGFTLRDAPIGISGLSGDLTFSQNRVIFDHLPATVNGGRADLSGEVELSRPVKVRASATLEGVAPHLPASVDSKVSGQLQMAGTFDSMLLSGKLDVVTARYTQRVDLDKVDLKKRVAAPRGFDKSGEWLRFDVGLALGDVRVDNDLVRGAVRGELTVTGSLASLGVVGTLSMAPGAVATFRGHEFQLTHAVVDLTERRRIRAQLDVHGEAQVRDYQVYMHTFGPLDDPQLQLTSQPALTQEDIVTLLSLGVTSRDTAVFAKGEGALAGVGQALLDATGLADQLKRWLPKDVVQDVNFRLTSAYSEATGQVVPKAEAEARMKVDLEKALAWKLKPFDARLRYQAPLSTASQGRGQKIQTELRFTDKLSAQVQADNDNVDVGWDIGLDFRLRWESKD
jgi:translocation and assembly module TamB